MKKTYAVIIPTHNRVPLLKRALQSVLEQTLVAHEIHVIVDEPQDLEKYRFLQDYPDSLRYNFTGGGFGGSGARNFGLDRVGDVDFVFFLDDDDEWLPEKAAEQVGLLNKDGDLVGVTCWNYKISNTSETLIERLETRQLNQGIKVWNTIGSFSFFGLRWKGAAADVRLTESLQSSQDWDYYLRVVELGGIGVIQKPLVRYHDHGGPKISGNPHKKASSLKQILNINYGKLHYSERALHRARIAMFEIEQGGARFRQFGRLMSAAFHSARSGRFYFARKIVKRSLISFFK